MAGGVEPPKDEVRSSLMTSKTSISFRPVRGVENRALREPDGTGAWGLSSVRNEVARLQVNDLDVAPFPLEVLDDKTAVALVRLFFGAE